jgi:hypothetical protein
MPFLPNWSMLTATSKNRTPGDREGHWQTVILMTFWTDTQTLVAAAAAKRTNL